MTNFFSNFAVFLHQKNVPERQWCLKNQVAFTKKKKLYKYLIIFTILYDTLSEFDHNSAVITVDILILKSELLIILCEWYTEEMRVGPVYGLNKNWSSICIEAVDVRHVGKCRTFKLMYLTSWIMENLRSITNLKITWPTNSHSFLLYWDIPDNFRQKC